MATLLWQMKKYYIKQNPLGTIITLQKFRGTNVMKEQIAHDTLTEQF
jgi:hypothetical protein